MCNEYDAWLRKQPLYFQQEVLSDETLQSFHSGVEVEKFKDENYRPIDMEELKRLDDRDMYDS